MRLPVEIMDFGQIHLNDAIEKHVTILKKLSTQEQHEFYSFGAKREYEDESIYEGTVDAFGVNSWETLVSVHGGRIFKVGLNVLRDPSQKTLLEKGAKGLADSITQATGVKPVKPLFKPVYEWHFDDGWVNIFVRSVPGMTSLNFVAGLRK